jgi:hypothetical protein
MSVAQTQIVTAHGGFRVTFGNVQANSLAIVLASITEIDGNNRPFLGSAIMHIDNVVPQDGSVLVRGNIDWNSDLRARVSIYIP